MSKIDWSKAPEGATHATSGSGGGTFYRRFDDRWALWVGDSWIFSVDWADWLVTPGCFMARPSPWAGEGLPPVGTVCEISMRPEASGDAADIERYRDHIGRKVEIIAHHDIGGDCLAAVYAISRDFTFEYHSLIEGNFRQIRTPEQIAAEAREHNVRNACTDISKALAELHESEEPTAVAIIEAMIDAGYSKQVMP